MFPHENRCWEGRRKLLREETRRPKGRKKSSYIKNDAWKRAQPVSYTHLDVYKRQPLTEESEPGEVLRFWLDKQGKRLVKGSRIAQTRRVNEMLRDVADDASLREALEALHLICLLYTSRCV